jgi:hypothetical protein
LRKTLLWSQSDPILDLVVLEEAAAPVRIAVLGAEKLSLYRMRDGRWQAEQVLDIVHNKPWPHDLRGRLFPGSNHLPDVYLPGVICHTTAVSPIALNCHDGEDPWPLMPSISVPGTYAFFAPARNFFTGDLTVGGKVTSVPKFYSVALLQRDRDLLWFFSAVDRQVHIVDSGGDRMTKLNWGSDLTSVKTACGAGWQILATASEDGTADSVRAYEVPDRDPVAVSAVLDFPGAISALWTESKADTAIAVARNPETGNYEAFRVAVACNQ